MDSEQPRKTSTAFELFLYAAIIAETGLAALIYKVIFRSPDMARMRIYFAIFYFAFLAWAIAQLNILHRDRTASVVPSSPAAPLSQEQKRIEDAAAAEDAEEPTAGHTGPLLGLSGPQLVIVVVVFATAVVTFSWALRLLE
jgi:hypothetical protein